MHALIIEQDAWISLEIQDALAELGYTSFDFATSGEEALALAGRRRPDLITSDFHLGSGNGIEAVQAIRENGKILVVFVTSTGWEVRGADPDMLVVQKPFRPDDLKSAISTAHTGKAE